MRWSDPRVSGHREFATSTRGTLAGLLVAIPGLTGTLARANQKESARRFVLASDRAGGSWDRPPAVGIGHRDRKALRACVRIHRPAEHSPFNAELLAEEGSLRSRRTAVASSRLPASSRSQERASSRSSPGAGAFSSILWWSGEPRTPIDSRIYEYHKIILDYHNDRRILLSVAIEVRLDLMLARRKMRLTELSERVGISMTNLSLLKTGKVKAIRFSTLDALCRELACQPGDLLEFAPEDV